MPDPAEIQIADAIVEALNGEDWSLEFTAVREYRPIATITELAEVVKVSVVPAAWETERRDRAAFADEIGIDIGIQNKPEEIVNEKVDPIYALVVEIRNYCREALRNATLFGPGLPIRLAQEPLWSPSHLREFGLLTSVLRITFRAVS